MARATQEKHYLEAFPAFLENLPEEPDGLTALRRGALERFAELGFPHLKLEEWRKTNVAPIAKTAFDLASTDGAGLEPEALSSRRFAGCDTAVVVNGRFNAELSDLSEVPERVTVSGLADALMETPELLEGRLAAHAGFDSHPFVALNTAFFRDGLLIHVPRGVVVERPVHVLLAGRPGGEPEVSFPRLLIVAEENAELTVVEQYVSLGEGEHLTCPVTELIAEPGAVVDHYKLQRENRQTFHMATFQLDQDRASAVSSHSISWGGRLVRTDTNAIVGGEGADSNLNGLYMVEEKQLVDNHMRVEHVAAHCTSHELYKGILEGKGRAVFNGRIYVHEGAQKTDAKQSNRNLLLSEHALVNSNPQLEIFADDVKCTHGSTVGRLDDLAVFYLRSRGIGEEAAQSLLTYAFASDIVERIKVEPLRRELEEFLFRRLPQGDIVRQAV